MVTTDVKSYKSIYGEFSKNPEQFIEKCEGRFDDFLINCVNEIKKKKTKRVFICGQSASGKTTTALRLTAMLCKNGFNAHIIELDDFFLPRERQKRTKSGKEDFESIFSLDLKSIYKFGKSIREKKPVLMPEFDFKTGVHSEDTELVIGSEDILVIEGLHSFNERIVNALGEDGKNLKIYVTLASSLNLGDTTLSKTDLRFARRLIRDYYHRNAGPEWTIELWRMVRAGEKRYADGYMKNADIFFDTFLDYEIFIHKKDFTALAKLGAEKAESKGYYKTLLGKFKKIDDFFEISVPERSILNEFTE